jgi:hypothetical protein
MISVDLVILKATSNSNKKIFEDEIKKKKKKTDRKKNSRFNFLFSSNLKLNYIKNVLI